MKERWDIELDWHHSVTTGIPRGLGRIYSRALQTRAWDTGDLDLGQQAVYWAYGFPYFPLVPVEDVE